MSLLLITSPEKTINGLLSNVNAGRSQLPYEFKREDYQVTDVVVSGAPDDGYARIILDAIFGDITNLFTIGGLIEYEGGDNGTYNGLQTIKNVLFNGTLTFVTIDQLHTIDENGGYINLLTDRPNYNAEIEIRNSDNSSPLVPLTFRYATEDNGRLFIDVGQILTDLLELTPDNSIQYILAYRENWEGADEPWSQAPVIQNLYAKKQIGLLGGSNMWENLLRNPIQETCTAISGYDGFQSTVSVINSVFIIGDIVRVQTDLTDFSGAITYVDAVVINVATNGVIPVDESGIQGTVSNYGNSGNAKLLTKFKNPFAWKGWNRNASYLIDSDYASRVGNSDVLTQSVLMDRNKNILFTVDGQYIDNPQPQIIQYNLRKDEEGSLYPTLFYEGVRARMGTVETVISETVLYEIKEECSSPIMVEWLSRLGVPEQHLFSINQEVNIQASPGLAYETGHTKDQEYITRDKNRVFSQDTQSMILTAENLTNNQIKALAEIKTSTQVNVYLSKDGSSKIGVICREALGSPYDSKGTRQEFRLVIEFPDNYDFYEAKQY